MVVAKFPKETLNKSNLISFLKALESSNIKGQSDKVRIPKRLQIEDDDETAEEIRPPRVHMPTNLGVPITFATPEADVRDHPRIGGGPLDEGRPPEDGAPLDDGQGPPEANEHEGSIKK